MRTPPTQVTVAPAPARPPASYVLAQGQVSIGATATYRTRPDDTLPDIARTYDLGYTQLVAANRTIDPWLPGTGRAVALPTAYLLPDVPHDGIVINLSQHRLFYFPKGTNTVETFPIGVGVQGRATPLGVTRVTGKETHPVWVPPPSIRAEEPDLPRVVAAGPDNPLGDYALTLGWPRYLIHGTNKPDGVGRNVSHGCMHLYPEDMARLFAEVPIGTPVRVIDQEVAAAWLDGELYVAVFPNKLQADQLDLREPVDPAAPANLKERIRRAAGARVAQVDWSAVEAAAHDRTGMPIRVTAAPIRGEFAETPTGRVSPRRADHATLRAPIASATQHDTDRTVSTLLLAPDSGSANNRPQAGANQALAAARTQWPGALWGECQGSGAKPYQVRVDLAVIFPANAPVRASNFPASTRSGCSCWRPINRPRSDRPANRNGSAIG